MDKVKLKAIAQKVLDKISNNDPEKFGSVIAILMIISIMLTVIRVLQECNKNKMSTFSTKEKTQFFAGEIKKTIIRRTWFTKMTIKKAIRRELGVVAYKEHGNALMNAILDIGEELKEDELITLAEAANV